MLQKPLWTKRSTVTVIGAGAVGKSLVKALRNQGFSDCRLVGRGSSPDRRFAHQLRIEYYSDLSKIIQNNGIILITVQDLQIHTVIEELTGFALPWKRLTVFHTSGVLGPEPLRPLARRGAAIAAWHPYQTFPKKSSAVPLPGVTFGITGNPPGEAAAVKLTRILGGQPIRIPARKRVLYHASAVFACGFVAANLQVAIKLLQECGLSEQPARQAALVIARQTAANVETLGADRAVTGPAVRADRETMRKHVQEIKKFDPQLAAVYREFSQLIGKTTGK